MKLRLMALTLLALVLTGCMGKMAVTQKLTTFNL
jgi:PBP1b-binding outer membrane lipoprotein LpoB